MEMPRLLCFACDGQGYEFWCCANWNQSLRCWRLSENARKTDFQYIVIYIYTPTYILVSNIYIKLRELSFFKGIVHPKWKLGRLTLMSFQNLIRYFLLQKNYNVCSFLPYCEIYPTETAHRTRANVLGLDFVHHEWFGMLHMNVHE